MLIMLPSVYSGELVNMLPSVFEENCNGGIFHKCCLQFSSKTTIAVAHFRTRRHPACCFRHFGRCRWPWWEIFASCAWEIMISGSKRGLSRLPFTFATWRNLRQNMGWWMEVTNAPSRILQSFVLLLKLSCEPPLLQKNQRLVSPSQILIESDRHLKDSKGDGLWYLSNGSIAWQLYIKLKWGWLRRRDGRKQIIGKQIAVLSKNDLLLQDLCIPCPSRQRCLHIMIIHCCSCF